MSIQGIVRLRKPLSGRGQNLSVGEQSSRGIVPQPFYSTYEFFLANSQLMDS